MDARLTAIRVKNRAYAALYRAVLLCERRRHSAGRVPPAWLARLAVLAGEYAEALGALEAVRRQWWH